MLFIKANVFILIWFGLWGFSFMGFSFVFNNLSLFDLETSVNEF